MPTVTQPGSSWGKDGTKPTAPEGSVWQHWKGITCPAVLGTRPEGRGRAQTLHWEVQQPHPAWPQSHIPAPQVGHEQSHEAGLNQQAFGRTKLQSKRAVAVLNGDMVLFSFIEMFHICNQQIDVCIKNTKLLPAPAAGAELEAGAALPLLRTASSWEVSLCVFGPNEHSLSWLLQPKMFPALSHSRLSWSNDNFTCTPGNWVMF